MAEPADLIMNLGRQLSKEREIAMDLWTWLPSYKEAETEYGDYVQEHFPGAAAVMAESCEVLAARLSDLHRYKTVLEELAKIPCRRGGKNWELRCGSPNTCYSCIARQVLADDEEGEK